MKDNYNYLNNCAYVGSVYSLENITATVYIYKLDIYTYMLYCFLFNTTLEESKLLNQGYCFMKLLGFPGILRSKVKSSTA